MAVVGLGATIPLSYDCGAEPDGRADQQVPPTSHVGIASRASDGDRVSAHVTCTSRSSASRSRAWG
jgi:hypothetical protein